MSPCYQNVFKRWTVTFFTAPLACTGSGSSGLNAPGGAGAGRSPRSCLRPPSTHKAHSARSHREEVGRRASSICRPARGHPGRGGSRPHGPCGSLSSRPALRSLFWVEDIGTPSQKVGPLCWLSLRTLRSVGGRPGTEQRQTHSLPPTHAKPDPVMIRKPQIPSSFQRKSPRHTGAACEACRTRAHSEGTHGLVWALSTVRVSMLLITCLCFSFLFPTREHVNGWVRDRRRK